MKKSIALLLLLFSLVTLGVIGCGGASTSGGSTSTSEGNHSTENEVHMNGQQFVQSSVTIRKGSRLTLINDAAVVHVIQNGTLAAFIKEEVLIRYDPQVNASGRM